jgi:hypothetical protein
VILKLNNPDLLEKQQAIAWLESKVTEGLNAPASAFDSASASEVITRAKVKNGFQLALE